ncbi:S-layer homology domain-containing protein [Ructibacterium gallinarum]|uniref:S-layer homology domain-containing protein n=1 Tax=Ructibacterium gallinarum TaxID=2779355 RepID=A0A9D5M515_9FIRM|nr:S-layer homology domain-containing protein [Ructibacterium gallinarum]MBE5039572.1 S-layer homology domain-containing protein [Ructibacterium gallinarum]
MKKFIVLFGLILTIYSTNCFAQIQTDDNGTFVVSDSQYAVGEKISIEVYKPGKKFSDLQASPEAFQDSLLYWEQTEANENGNFYIEIILDNEEAESGIYTAYIYPESSKAITPEKFLYTNPETAKIYVEQIKTAYHENRIADIEDIIKNHPYELWIDDVAKEYCPYIASVVTSYMQDTDPNLSEAKMVFRIAGGMAKLKNNRLSGSVLDESIQFSLDTSPIREFLGKDYVTEAIGRAMTSRLTGVSFGNISEFESKLTEAFVLSVVADPNGLANTKEVMKAFAEEIGTGATGSDARYNYVSNKSFESYAELKATFDGYRDNNGGGGTSSSSGMSGTGSSNSGWGGTYVTEDKATHNENISAQPIPQNIFDDIGNVPWAIEAIVNLAEQKIINGRSENRFEPNENITREEFIKIAVGAFIPDEEAAEISFSDVSRNDWSYEYIAKAYGFGVIVGYDDGRFGKNDFISRQDMATVLFRLAEKLGYTFDNGSEGIVFDDDGIISDYAKDAVYSLKAIGVINGIDEYNFAPITNATRAEAANMIYSLTQQL